VGTGGFVGRAIMQPWDMFYWICSSIHSTPVSTGGFLGGHHVAQDVVLWVLCPLVTPTPYWHWGIFWRASCGLGCCSIGYASSHSHSDFTSAWFASSHSHPHSLTIRLGLLLPSPPAIHLPIPHCQVCSASLNIST